MQETWAHGKQLPGSTEIFSPRRLWHKRLGRGEDEETSLGFNGGAGTCEWYKLEVGTCRDKSMLSGATHVDLTSKEKGDEEGCSSTPAD